MSCSFYFNFKLRRPHPSLVSAGRICRFLPQSFNLIFPRRELGAIAEPMCNYHHHLCCYHHHWCPLQQQNNYLMYLESVWYFIFWIDITMQALTVVFKHASVREGWGPTLPDYTWSWSRCDLLGNSLNKPNLKSKILICCCV